MVREVLRLVSEPPTSSVLLSDGVLLLLAICGAATTGTGGSKMSTLGVTWNLPTVTGADFTSVMVKDKKQVCFKMMCSTQNLTSVKLVE